MKETDIDEATEAVRQSIIENKGRKNFTKDFSGDVFELTSEMLIRKNTGDFEETSDHAKIAEGILQKYAKMLSV